MTNAAKPQAILNLFTSNMHRGSWREPGTSPEQWIDYELYKWCAQTAERGKLHSLFLADTGALVFNEGGPEVLSRSAWLLRPEPLTLAAAMAAVTTHIGMICTASTTYNSPYNVARSFAMLDHISGGRAGWNVVTSHMADEPGNYGLNAALDHATRYKRGEEFHDVVEKLWDSWEDDAFLRDQASGIYLDPAKMHRLDHKGEFFSVGGPLNVSRPPQGHPVIAQAGASKDGQALAAKIAEVMFTLQSDISQAQDFYIEMRNKVQEAGRSADQIKILPMLQLVVGDTDAEAEETSERLDQLVDPIVGLSVLEQTLYFDLKGYPLDGPLPAIPPTERAVSQQQHIIEMAQRENLTIRQLAKRAGRGGVDVVAGSPQTIADHIEKWVLSQACDGFNLTFPDTRRSLAKFVDHVVPELQKRGIFRSEYSGTTLRENLGLARPAGLPAAN